MNSKLFLYEVAYTPDSWAVTGALWGDDVVAYCGFPLPIEATLAESEDSLVEHAITGDKNAFASLYDLHVDRIYRHVRYRVYNQAEAEDITQDVFLRAWKAIGRYQQTGAPFACWLTKIADNLIINHQKRCKKVVPLEVAEDVPDKDPSLEQQTEAALNKVQVKEAICTLKGEKQRVITMRFIDGLEYSEIAKALHKTEGAVRVIQHRALHTLRDYFSDKSRLI